MKNIHKPVSKNHNPKTLEARHRTLDEKIEKLSTSLLSRIRNDAEIQELKRQKLACKDAIERLRQQLTPILAEAVVALNNPTYGLAVAV